MRPGKIPVFRTAWAGVHFLFANFFNVVRASILPGLIAGTSLFALHWYVLPGLAGGTVLGIGEVRNPFLGLPIVAVYLFAVLMFSVGLARVYFGQPTSTLYAGARAQEFRFLGGTATAVLLMFVVCGLPLLVLAWTLFSFVDFSTLPRPVTRHVTVASTAGQQDMSMFAVIGVATAALLCFYVFMSLRFSLLLPVVAQENRFGVMRSWKLTNGNFWRLLFVLLLVSIAAMLLAIPFFMVLSPLLETVTGAPVGRLEMGGPITLDSFLTVPGLIRLGADAIYYLVIMSVYVGALSYAYQKLASDEVAPVA